MTLLGWITASAIAGKSDIGDERSLGVGLKLGDPSAFSGRFYLSSPHSIEADLGWSTIGWGGAYVGGSWLYAPSPFYAQNGVDVRFHVGAGAFLVGDTYRRDAPFFVGPRVPIGIDFDLWDVPSQIFVDLAFAATVIPAFDFGFDVSVGGRYYF